jgi:hypothetical protein
VNQLRPRKQLRRHGAPGLRVSHSRGSAATVASRFRVAAYDNHLELLTGPVIDLLVAPVKVIK